MCRAHRDCGSIKTSGVATRGGQPKLNQPACSMPGAALSRRQFMRYGLLLGIAAVSGCGSDKKPGDTGQLTDPNKTVTKTGAGPTAQISNKDECATRLHEIEGALLEYYLVNHRFPARLEDLRKDPDNTALELVCPVSKLPYIYNPVGIITLDHQPRMICYDPAPSHSGVRWAIAFIDERPNPNGRGMLAPYTKVVAVRESEFSLQP